MRSRAVFMPLLRRAALEFSVCLIPGFEANWSRFKSLLVLVAFHVFFCWFLLFLISSKGTTL